MSFCVKSIEYLSKCLSSKWTDNSTSINTIILFSNFTVFLNKEFIFKKFYLVKILMLLLNSESYITIKIVGCQIKCRNIIVLKRIWYNEIQRVLVGWFLISCLFCCLEKNISTPEKSCLGPSHRERISFRNHAVQLSGGWGAGKKRQKLKNIS